MLTGGRCGKALAACPLLGAAAGGFSGKEAPSAAMLELTASSMAAAWCWLERTGDGRRSERQRVERSVLVFYLSRQGGELANGTGTGGHAAAKRCSRSAMTSFRYSKD